MPVAQQRHGVRWIIGLGSLLPLIIAGVVGFVVVKKTGGIDHIGDAISRAADVVTGDRWTYSGQGNALLLDVSGDDHPDVIAPIRYVQKNDSYYIAAFDGLTGDQLWQSETFGNHGDAIKGRTALHGGVVAQSDSRGNISGFRASDGTRLWKISMGEKLEKLCADGESSLGLQLIDKKWKSLSLEDGTLTSLDAEPNPCAPVTMHREHGQPNLQYASDRRRRRRPSVAIEGMKVRDTVEVRDQPGVMIALGHKAPGTRVPMIALLRAEEGKAEEPAPSKKRRRRRRKRKRKAEKSRELLWSAELPALDPLSVKEGAPELVAVNQSYIAALYTPKDGNPHLVCFSREGGRRLWDSVLPDHTTYVLRAIDMSEQRVYVSQWSRLDAFKIEDGSLAFSLGH